jgi:xanthine dehydrogenase molybdenum-binding subunit
VVGEAAAATTSVRPKACPPHFIVIFVEVEVNILTGQVKVTNVVSGVDTGTVINLNNVEGQMVGGLHMGMGFAMIEDTIFDRKTGEPKNASFAGFHILTVKDMPDLDNINLVIADTFEPTGPLGAKGIGEGVTNPVAPAISNAIYNAVGVKINDLPITQEKLLAKIEEAKLINKF